MEKDYQSLEKKIVYIKGMHCVACETIIADELSDIVEIHSVTVCRKRQIAEIYYKHQEPQFDAIAKKIKNVGYNASLYPNEKTVNLKKASITDWIVSVLILFGLYILYKVFNNIGLLNWLDVDMSNVTYGVSFLIGIVASLSTCLAVVGAVVISFSAKYEARGNFYQSNIKPHLLFHASRLLTFAILGGLLGIVGSWFSFSNSFVGWFTVLIAFVLAWLGLNILGLLPSLSVIGISMPKNNMQIWKKLKESDHALAPIILGGFTFFLPCGFTQSMQLFAMSSGSFWTGALTMFLFALGTVPVLFGLGVATAKFKNMRSVIFQQVIGFVVILFSVYTLSSGFALAGINVDLLNSKTAGEVATKGNVQIINMTVSYQGFTPNVFNLKKGIPVRWVIDGQQVSGCLSEIISPSFDIKQKIATGQNVIEFTPDKVGTFGFSCWMGMVRGKFIVVDNK